MERQRYPLAGEKNPSVALRVVELSSGRVRTLYDGAWRGDYVLVPTWTPDGHGVVDEILERAQRRMRLVRFERDGRRSRTLVLVTDRHFVEAQTAPIFLRDGRRFVWLSERLGVQGLDLVDADTGAARRLTGSYAVASIARVDEHAGCVYVDARYPTRRDRALLRIPLGGGRERELKPEAGTHALALPQRGEAFIDSFSSLTTPPRIELRGLRDGDVVATLFRTPSLRGFDLGTTRASQIPSRWKPLDAYLIEPPGFDPSHRYPVIVNAYGGPLPVAAGLPSDDRWPGLYDHLLAEHGFLVFTVDGPASRFDRSADARLFAGRMGTIAMEGQLAGVRWLTAQPYLDPARLGLFGWSYGGYLTAFTLTHAPGVFRSGIAGAPVVDWRYYDSAYTERYLGTPQQNPRAYARTSGPPRGESAALTAAAAARERRRQRPRDEHDLAAERVRASGTAGRLFRLSRSEARRARRRRGSPPRYQDARVVGGHAEVADAAHASSSGTSSSMRSGGSSTLAMPMITAAARAGSPAARVSRRFGATIVTLIPCSSTA